MGNDEQETEPEQVRAYTGALILAEAAADLRALRTLIQKALTKS